MKKIAAFLFILLSPALALASGPLPNVGPASPITVSSTGLINSNYIGGAGFVAQAGQTFNLSAATVVLPSISPSPTNTVTVANIAALRASSVATVVNGQYIQTAGYSTVNDGGQGTFIWNSTSTAADNGGTIIQVTGVATGRWIEFTKSVNSVNVRWFGAKGDGTSNDYASIVAAISAVSPCGTVYFPSGHYITTSTISVTDTNASPAAINFTGDGYASTWILEQGSGTAGCMVWTGQPVATGSSGPGAGVYVAVVTGAHQLRNISLGSLNGPALTMNFCSKALLENVYWISASATSQYLLVQNSTQCFFKNLGEAYGNGQFPGPVPSRNNPLNAIFITNTLYSGSLGSQTSQCGELFFTNCRTDAAYSQWGIIIQSASANATYGPSQLGKLHFTDCKLSGPGTGSYGTMYISGCQKIYIEDTFLEPNAASVPTMVIDNQYGSTQVSLDNVDDFSRGYLDLGTNGGSSGGAGNIIYLTMRNCSFGNMRANYNAAIYGSISVKDCIFTTAPTTTVLQAQASMFEYVSNKSMAAPLGTPTSLTDSVSGNINFTNFTNSDFNAPLTITAGYSVATLNSNFAPASYKGSRAFVNDSNQTVAANGGAIVTGGGANTVPVFSDGANWRIE